MVVVVIIFIVKDGVLGELLLLGVEFFLVYFGIDKGIEVKDFLVVENYLFLLVFVFIDGSEFVLVFVVDGDIFS